MYLKLYSKFKNRLKKLLVIGFVLLNGSSCFSQEKPITTDLRDECVRGQAQPIVVPTKKNKANFQLQSDSLTGIETFYSKAGDFIQINNWGCEYYTLTFRIQTTKFKADTSALNYWYIAAYKLMKKIEINLNAPLALDDGLEALNSHISKHVFDLKLNEQIDFGGEEIRSFVSIEKIEKLEPQKFAITITFSVGPL